MFNSLDSGTTQKCQIWYQFSVIIPGALSDFEGHYNSSWVTGVVGSGRGETLHGDISYLITRQRAAIGGEYSARHNPERRPALRRILDRGELGEGSRRLSAYCVQYVNVGCRQL